MELLLWLEQLYLWRLQRKENETMFGRRNDDKITEHPEYVGNQYTPKHMLDKAVNEYERGLLVDLEGGTDPTIRRVMNEIKVRAIDNAKRRR